MAIYEVKVSFYTDVEASTHEEIEEAISNLVNQLGNTKTDLAWDDVDWNITHAPQPLAAEEASE